MADDDRNIAALNKLIAVTLDSVEGYGEAADDSGNDRFSAIFRARAGERRAVASDLQAEVERLGGTPTDNGSVLGSAHRMFASIKAAVAGKDDRAIVDEVERGEDHIKAKFEEAMADPDLSPTVRALIEGAYRPVREGHDQMRDLKHTLHADD